jgi:UDP-N-acetylglucosamine 2-epimerase (non-hydrolysing)
MVDTLLANLGRLDPDSARAAHNIPDRYALATIHRQSNVDEAEDAGRVVQALTAVARHVPVVLPLHPRGRAMLEGVGLAAVTGLRVVEPLGYLEFASLMRGATLVITDSGGVQEETTALDVPCLTLRPNTERPITISHGTNRLVTLDSIEAASLDILAGRATFPVERPPLWDGRAGDRIAAVIAGVLNPSPL